MRVLVGVGRNAAAEERGARCAGPELMPGARRDEDRVARAHAFSLRQDEVYAKTRELVELEGINSFLAWKSATDKMAIAKERFERSQRAAKLGRENASNAKIPFETLVRNEALAGRAQGDYLTAVYEHLKALARLRRVTAGGVVPAFPNR